MQHTSACSAKVPGVTLLRACRAPKWQPGKHRHKGQASLLATAISTREVTETTAKFESFFNSLGSDLTSEQSAIPAGYFEILESINALRPEFANLQEQELAAVSEELRGRYDAGSTLDELLPEAFALVREATYRKLGKAHYDVQLMGGIVLHRGSIAEMATGEGKSLTGILPAYLYALSGGCVCMVTVNDYLAKRDAQLFHTVFQLLGMEVQYALNSMSHQERKDVYESADIVYATAYTLAFDYLHDTRAIDASHLALPTLGFAVIDEVDQILIDNAMMPFILADPASFWNEALQERIRQACAVASGIVYKELSLTAGMQDTPQNAAKVAMLKGVLQGVPGDISQALEQQVILGAHQEIAVFAYKNGLNHQSHKLSLFNQNWSQQNVEVSAIGSLYAKHKVMSMFGVDEEAWRKHKWPALIHSALIAFLLHRRDVDYTIAPNPQTGKRSVILIDKATSAIRMPSDVLTLRCPFKYPAELHNSKQKIWLCCPADRLLPSTKLQNFMHEFVTAKHEIEVDRPTISQTKITYAKLFERFQKVVGMTGTAKESANAFWECYKLSVRIPLHC